MWCHLSALAGFFVPFGNILGPLIIWQTKKHELPSVEAHGKAAVNFQLTVTIAVVAGVVAAIPLSFICVGYLLIPVVAAIGVCGMVFAVIAGIKANDGQDYRYPYSFNLI
jgi:hypothetical protein